MGYYKIKNITNNLGKRDTNKDLTLNVEYNVGFQKKYKKLPPNEEIIMQCKSLPASIHTLRVKKFIKINEISENEFIRLQKPSSGKKSKDNSDEKKIESNNNSIKNSKTNNKRDDEKVENKTSNKKDNNNNEKG